MTVLSDALARAITYDVTNPIDPVDKRLHRDLADRCDCPYPNATLDAVDEVQTITAGDRTGGTFDLAFTLVTGETFNVTGLASNATASAVQTAVDAAAALAVTNYIAGDIAVTGGPFGSGGANTVFTFSGSSVRGNHPLIVGTYTSLTGGTTDPSESQTTAGVVPRFWFAALKQLGVISGTDPVFGAVPAGQYTAILRAQIENYPSNGTIQRLIKEATVQEGQDWEGELYPLFGYPLP